MSFPAGGRWLREEIPGRVEGEGKWCRLYALGSNGWVLQQFAIEDNWHCAYRHPAGKH